MAVLVWSKPPMTVIRGYEARHGQTPLSPLVMWAAWAVESLHYLDDLDQAHAAYPASVKAHNPDIVDIAHVRWATGTAITSLDLCAAALGRVYCAWTGRNELDLRNFTPRKRRIKTSRVCKSLYKMFPTSALVWIDRMFADKVVKAVDKRRSMLPASAIVWVDAVLADRRYKQILDLRHNFTHSRLNRHLYSGGVGGHESRTHFKIRKTEKTLNARDLVELARDLATEQVTAFLNVLDGS